MESLFLHIPSRILFGRENRMRLGSELLRYGRRALLITEDVFRSGPLLDELQRGLSQNGAEAIVYSEIGPETTSRAAERCLDLAKSGHVEVIVGLGGVRALSIAKAVASLGSTVFDLDNLTDLQHSDSSVYPYIEIPTTCRSPFMLSESLLLTDARNRRTRLIRRRGSFPKSVLIDPDLTASLSPRSRAATILDTLLHSLEGFFSVSNNFLSGSVLLRSIGLAVDYIDAFDRSEEPQVASRAAQAGLVSAFGLTMCSPGIGSAVSFCASSLHRVPKSGIAAVMLPVILEYARRACPEKLVRMAPIVDEETRSMRTPEAAELVIGALRRRIDSFELPLRLSDYGIRSNDLPTLAAEALSLGLTEELPTPLSEKELLELLRDAL